MPDANGNLTIDEVVVDLQGRLQQLEATQVKQAMLQPIIDECKALGARIKTLEDKKTSGGVSSKEITSLPAYEGDPAKYEKWAFKVRQYMAEQNVGFVDFLEGLESLPQDPTTTDLSDYAFNHSVTPEDLKKQAQMLWKVVSQRCCGATFNMLRNLERTDQITRGPVAWYRMFKEAKGVTGIRLQGLLTRILTPAARLSKIEEIVSGIELWESYVHEYNHSKGSDLDDSELLFGFKNLLPIEFATLLQNMGYESYTKAKFYIIQQVTQRRVATFAEAPTSDVKPKPKEKDSMDTMHVASWDYASPIAETQTSEEIEQTGNEVYGVQKGKGKGFQGNCRHCGIWGHRLNECRKLTAELQKGGGKKGESRGQSKGDHKGKGKGSWDYGGKGKGYDAWSYGKGYSGYGSYGSASYANRGIHELSWNQDHQEQRFEPYPLFSMETASEPPRSWRDVAAGVPSKPLGASKCDCASGRHLQPAYVSVTRRQRTGASQPTQNVSAQQKDSFLSRNSFADLEVTEEEQGVVRDELGLAEAQEESAEEAFRAAQRLGPKVGDSTQEHSFKMQPIRKSQRAPLDLNSTAKDQAPVLNYLQEQPASDPVLSFVNAEWEEINTVIDSGAAVSVAPMTVGQAFPLIESEGSKKGQVFHTASGGAVANKGEKRIPVETTEGVPFALNFQVADITRPLASVAKICDAGHAGAGNSVVVHRDGGYILSLDTGHRTHFERVNGVYVLKTWARKASGSVTTAPFHRQG